MDVFGEEAGVWLHVPLPAVDGGLGVGFCPRLGALHWVVPSHQDRCQAGGSSHQSSTCSCTAEIQAARSWARKRERLLWGLPGLGRDGGEVAVVALCENCPGLLSKSWRFKRIRGETERKSHAATPKP